MTQNRKTTGESPKYERVTFTFQGKRYSRRGRTMAEAIRKAAILEEQLKRGEIGISSNMRVKAWLDTYLETYVRPKVGEGYCKDFQNYLAKISDEVGNLKLKSVTDVHLQKILNSFEGKSKSFITKLYQTMRAVFRRAYLSRLIPTCPSDYIQMPKMTAGKRRSITEFERKHILAVAGTHRAGTWIKLMLYAGLRPCECRALQWRHIDFKRRMIHIEQAVKHKTNTIGKPKSAAGTRMIPMKSELHDELYKLKGLPFDHVIKSASGKMCTATNLRRMWDGFKREADLSMGAKTHRNKIVLSVIAPDLVPYCLRHTYGTDMQAAGIDINITRALMGHEDIATTSKVYIDITDSMLDDVAEKINCRSC